MNMNAKNLADLLQGLAGGSDDKEIPATRDEVRVLIEGSRQQLAVGDIVEWADPLSATHTVPKQGERVIVTRIVPDSASATHKNGYPQTIGVAYKHLCGMEGCPSEGRIREMMLDGRRFRKVGTALD